MPFIPVYPDSVAFHVQIDSSWVDLTSDWIDDLTGSWGVLDDDFMADPGVLVFILDNMDQRYTPGHASALTGWVKGIRAKLEIIFQGITYPFLGTVTDIDIPLGADRVDKAKVIVSDWLEYAARTPLINPAIGTDQTADDMVNSLAALVPIAPQATDLSAGVYTFPSAFDTVTRDTKIATELAKIARSELAPIYLRKDRAYGETLAVEAAHDRHGWRALDAIPKPAADSGALLLETGDYLLLESGDRLILEESLEFILDNETIGIVTDYGQNVINYFEVSANPRREDASAQILFQLDEPIVIASGKTTEIKGTYADPSGGLPVNGKNMITPAATTDYLMNTARDGSGSNITANLTIVSTDYGAAGFKHEVRNDSAYIGFITKFNCRGYGIYYYNPISHIAQDADSQTANGYETASLDQPYQVEVEAGALYAEKKVERERSARTVVRGVQFCPNYSAELMLAFLNLGPGSKVRIKHAQRGIDSHYYVQGVRNFKLSPGGLMTAEWAIEESLSLQSGLTQLAVEFTGAGAEDAVEFGHIPHLANPMDGRTVAAWVYLDDHDPNGTILALFSDDAGILFYVSTTLETLRFYEKYPSGAQEWRAPEGAIKTGTWQHVAATKVGNSDDDPVLYINGHSVTVTRHTTPHAPAENPNDEEGAPVMIGNVKTATIDYTYGLDGKIKDVRFYNRILSADEVAELYNSGRPDASLVTDGLQFQAFAVRTADYNDFQDQALDSDDRVLENMFGYIGKIHGTPTGRAP